MGIDKDDGESIRNDKRAMPGRRALWAGLPDLPTELGFLRAT